MWSDVWYNNNNNKENKWNLIQIGWLLLLHKIKYDDITVVVVMVVLMMLIIRNQQKNMKISLIKISNRKTNAITLHFQRFFFWNFIYQYPLSMFSLLIIMIYSMQNNLVNYIAVISVLKKKLPLKTSKFNSMSNQSINASQKGWVSILNCV